MIDYSKKEIKMSLSELKKYLSEWIAGDLQSSVEAGKYDSFEKIYKLKSECDGEVLFSQKFGCNEVIDENTAVSTNGIVDDELRGLIVQCRCLDNRIKIAHAENQTQATNLLQKGV